MENKTFYNCVNLVRAILEGACKEIDLGLAGQNMVMEHLVEPMVSFLFDKASILPLDGEMIDVLVDKLDDDFEVPPEMAAMAIERIRAVRRLTWECIKVPKYTAAHLGGAVVVAVGSAEEAMQIMDKEIKAREEPRNAEFLLSNALVGIYDTWCEEELGDLHPALYNILKVGQVSCDIGLSKLDGKGELNFDERMFELQREGYEALEAVNERMDELLMDYPEYRNAAEDGEAYEGNGDMFGNGPIFPFS